MDAAPHSSLDARSEELLAHAAWLRPLARSLVRDGAAAEDVLQETWLAALRAAPNEPGRVKPWLAHVLANVARRAHRTETRRLRRERAVARAEELADTSDTVARIDAQRALAAAVGVLPEPYRRTIVLRYFDGLDASAIARRENVAPSTVRSRVAHGLELLRAELDRRAGGDRDVWAFALAPFVPSGAADIAQVAVSATGGVLLVNTLSRVVIGAVVVALGFWVYVAREDRDSEYVDSAHIVAEAVALDADTASTLGTGTVEPEGERVSAVLASDADSSAPAASTAAHVSIRGTLVDELRRPIAGATFALSAAPLPFPVDPARPRSTPATTSTSSGTSGRFVLECDDSPRPRDFVYAIRATGRASSFGALRLEPSQPLELGELVLAPGAQLRGRVLDADGALRADAEVSVAPVEEWPPADVVRALGPSPEMQLLTTRTDASGEFTIDGLRAGFVRAVAHAQGTSWTVSEPLDVAAGAANAPVELVLALLAATDFVRGRVLGADGVPRAGASVECLLGIEQYSRSATMLTDALGRFEFAGSHRARCWLGAKDVARLSPPVEVKFNEFPEQEVILRFAPETTCVLRVLDDGGALLTPLTVQVREGGQRERSVSVTRSVDANGLLRFPVRRGSVAIVVGARGWPRTEFGPFDAGDVELAAECRFARVPGIRGVVLADGVPVAGARIELNSVVLNGHAEVDGYVSRFQRGGADPVSTGADGTFTFVPRRAGVFALLCEAPGFATTEFAVPEFDPAHGIEGLVVRLGAGGAIEGEVAPVPGQSAAGALVVLERYDGRPRFVRADEHGRYRAEQLTPGPWHVSLARGPVSTARTDRAWPAGIPITFRDETPMPLPSNCTLADGETEQFDLSAVAVELLVAITVEGQPAVGWTCGLRSPHEDFIDADATRTATDADGRARIEFGSLELRKLVVTPANEDGARLRFEFHPALAPGVNTANAALRFGSVAGRVADLAKPQTVRWRWVGLTPQRTQDWVAEGEVRTDERGEFTLPRVPASAHLPEGDVRLECAYRSDDGAWVSKVARAVVVAGETTQVELR